MRHGTIGIETGNRGKTGADKMRLTRAGSINLLINSHLAHDLTTGHGLFKPGKKFTQGDTIGLHGFTHILDIRRCFT